MGPNGGEDGDGGEMKCLKLLEVRSLARLALLMPLSCYASCLIEKSKHFFLSGEKMPAGRPFGQAHNCEDEPDSAGL